MKFLTVASETLISKLIVRHSPGDKRRNENRNKLNYFKKLNEDDWMFEKGVKTRNQRKIFEL